MARKNAYLAKLQAEKTDSLRFHRKFTMQWCADAAILAANEVFGRRGKKLVEFHKKFIEYAEGIARMTLEDAKGDKSIEYTREKIDGRLKELLGEDFQDWDTRYTI